MFYNTSISLSSSALPSSLVEPAATSFLLITILNTLFSVKATTPLMVVVDATPSDLLVAMTSSTVDAEKI